MVGKATYRHKRGKTTIYKAQVMEVGLPGDEILVQQLKSDGRLVKGMWQVPARDFVLLPTTIEEHAEDPKTEASAQQELPAPQELTSLPPAPLVGVTATETKVNPDMRVA